MLSVAYTGHYAKPRYSCRRGRQMHGIEPCISFGARRPDQVVGAEILLVVEPLAVEAALMAEREAITQIDEHRDGSVSSTTTKSYVALLSAMHAACTWRVSAIWRRRSTR